MYIFLFQIAYKKIISFSLVKLSKTLYSIGFSEDGTYYSHIFGDSTMLTMLNDKQSSDNRAIEIYVTDPHLSPD